MSIKTSWTKVSESARKSTSWSGVLSSVATTWSEIDIAPSSIFSEVLEFFSFWNDGNVFWKDVNSNWEDL